jgi:hypothetical protein
MFGHTSDFLLGIAAATLWFGLQGVSDARDDAAFTRDARTVLAQPVRHMRAIPYQRGGQVRHIDYDADFTFTTAAGKTVTVWHVPVTEAQHDDLAAGRQLVLQYLPGDPATVRFPGWQPQPPNTRWVLLAVAALASVGFWLVRKREQRLLRIWSGPRKYDGPLRTGDPRPVHMTPPRK